MYYDEHTYLNTTFYHVRSLYCGKWRKISKTCCDLDLDRTVPNVEPIRDIFMLGLQ